MRFQALIIVHYAHMVTLSMALNLPLNTLGLIITYNVLNLESLSYTGFWDLTTCTGVKLWFNCHILPVNFFHVGLQWDRKLFNGVFY